MSLISSLNQFSNETIADTPPINENFENVRVAINDNYNRIVELSTKTSNSITSLDQTITRTKQELEENFGNVAETKLNIDLSNLSKETYSTIFSDIAMNTSAGVSVASDWVATQNGWLYMKHKNTSDNQNFSVKIDGVEVYYSGDSGTWSDGHQTGSVAFIGKKQVLTYSGKGTNSVTFYPCIGGN